MILNPNCSEAVCRIKLDNLNAEEQAQLKHLVEVMSGEIGRINLDSRIEAPDENIVTNENDEVSWEDTNWEIKRIFSNNVLEIRGDIPYNCPDYLTDNFRTLVFYNKLEIEFDEP